MEHRFVVRRVRVNFPQLRRLPAALDGVVGDVENECVGVQVRVGDSIDRPRGRMDEYRVDKIPGVPCRIPAPRSDAGPGLGFEFD